MLHKRGQAVNTRDTGTQRLFIPRLGRSRDTQHNEIATGSLTVSQAWDEGECHYTFGVHMQKKRGSRRRSQETTGTARSLSQQPNEPTATFEGLPQKQSK